MSMKPCRIIGLLSVSVPQRPTIGSLKKLELYGGNDYKIQLLEDIVF